MSTSWAGAVERQDLATDCAILGNQTGHFSTAEQRQSRKATPSCRSLMIKAQLQLREVL